MGFLAEAQVISCPLDVLVTLVGILKLSYHFHFNMLSELLVPFNLSKKLKRGFTVNQHSMCTFLIE